MQRKRSRNNANSCTVVARGQMITGRPETDWRIERVPTGERGQKSVQIVQIRQKGVRELRSVSTDRRLLPKAVARVVSQGPAEGIPAAWALAVVF